MLMAMDREFMTAREAAECLNISLKTLYNYVSQGKIPFVKRGIGKGRRYIREDIQRLAEWRRERKNGTLPDE